MTYKADNERRGVILSVIGSALLATSAVVMALVAKSQAILLDGLYTVITLAMALVSLKVIDLLKKPETHNRPFGYMALEPFLNLVKSLIMLILLVFFLITNIQELCTGGRDIALDMTTLYIFICLAIYAVIILRLRRYRRGTSSSILDLEIKNWCVDAMITGGIAVSLMAAMLLIRMGYGHIQPYIDPLVVVALIVVSLPLPLKTFSVEIKRLLLISTENSIETEAVTQLRPVIQQFGLVNTHIWGLKSGRTHYLFVYCSLKDEHTTITELDRIRAAIFRNLSEVYPKCWADIMFTAINPDEPFPEKLLNPEVQEKPAD